MAWATDALRTLVGSALARARLDVRRLPRPEARAAMPVGAPYELVRPGATYAPWLSEAQFRRVYARVYDHTLVDEYRLYELWSLVRQTSHLAGDIVEVGVWRGGSGAVLACSARLSRSTSRVFLCDTFAGVVKASTRDSLYAGGEHADTSRATVERLVRSLDLDNVSILEGVFPDETGDALAGTVIRLCHIDVDVYDSAKDVLHWVWKRLVVGGIVVFDDYGFQACDGVTRLVDEESIAPDRVVVHNLNGHAVMVKTR